VPRSGNQKVAREVKRLEQVRKDFPRWMRGRRSCAPSGREQFGDCYQSFTSRATFSLRLQRKKQLFRQALSVVCVNVNIQITAAPIKIIFA
jgi:hypothetical protein